MGEVIARQVAMHRKNVLHLLVDGALSGVGLQPMLDQSDAFHRYF